MRKRATPGDIIDAATSDQAGEIAENFVVTFTAQLGALMTAHVFLDALARRIRLRRWPRPPVGAVALATTQRAVSAAIGQAEALGVRVTTPSLYDSTASLPAPPRAVPRRTRRPDPRPVPPPPPQERTPARGGGWRTPATAKKRAPKKRTAKKKHK